MNKNKYVLLGILLTVFIIIVISIVNIHFNKNKLIYIKEIPGYGEKINALNKKIDKVKNEDCKKMIISGLDRVKDTYYTSNISVKDYYENYNKDNVNFYEMFMNTLEVCEVEKIDPYMDDLIASRVYPESIGIRYNSAYEFRFIDMINYKNIYELSDNIGTYTSKEYELKSINSLLDEVNNEKSI